MYTKLFLPCFNNGMIMTYSIINTTAQQNVIFLKLPMSRAFRHCPLCGRKIRCIVVQDGQN